MTELTRNNVCDKHGAYIEKGTRFDMLSEQPTTIWHKCPACITERKEQDEARKAAIEWASVMRDASIPVRFRGKTMSNYTPDQQNAKAFGIVQDYASDPEKTKSDGRCLVLIGDYGTGKTHLAVGIIDAFAHAGIRSLYTTLDALLIGYKASFNREGPQEHEVMAHYRNMPLLVIDEVGLHRGSEEDARIISNIMDGRYADMRCTVIVSNLSAAELSAEVGDRVIDRMREGGGKLAVFKGASKRAGV